MDIDEQIIKEVRSRNILYDLGQQDYKNLKKKELAWREVAAAMRMSEIQCKKRWKGLRDSYKRCKRTRQVACGSAAKRPKKSWKYFEAMTFLDNVTSSRHTIGNISCASSEECVAETFDDLSDGFKSPPSVCSTSIQDTKQSDSQKFQNLVDFAASCIADTCGAVAKSIKKEDSTDLFFAALAAKVKAANMPPSVVNKIEAKLAASVFAEIQNFLSQKQ